MPCIYIKQSYTDIKIHMRFILDLLLHSHVFVFVIVDIVHFLRISIHYKFVCYLVLNKMYFLIPRRVFLKQWFWMINSLCRFLTAFDKAECFIASNHQRVDINIVDVLLWNNRFRFFFRCYDTSPYYDVLNIEISQKNEV